MPELDPQVVEEVGGPAGCIHRTLTRGDAGTEGHHLQVLACGGVADGVESVQQG